MPYWQLFYHLVWATKNRETLLTTEVEKSIYGYLLKKAIGLEATVYAMNGYENHVHIVASIPPKISVSKFVGQVKAVASVKYNQTNPHAVPFYWQEEFGAFSFDRKRLPNFVAYVQKQKEHHAEKKIIPALERETVNEIIREAAPVYMTEDGDWWQTMLEME
jgi:REP element-mobilizing transposase RayT